VTGHGVSSAIVTGLVHGATRALLNDIQDMGSTISIDETLIKLNSIVDKVIFEVEDQSNRVMTAVFAGINLEDGSGSLVDAGHGGAIIFGGEKIRTIRAKGFPLGFGRSNRNILMPFNLKTDESLLIFTDGLVENTGPDGKSLRIRQLLNLLKEHGSESGLKAKLLEHCYLVWQGQRPDDDCTFLIIKRTEPYPLTPAA